MSADRQPSIAIAVTGASGAIYATRTVAALLSRGVHVELVISDYGRRLLHDELGDQASVERMLPFLTQKYGEGVGAGRIVVHSNRDLGATIASGSHGCRGMVIVPCSMKTLAGVAVLLVYEQSLVKADDLSQVKKAFDLNGYVGIYYLLVLAACIYVR